MKTILALLTIVWCATAWAQVIPPSTPPKKDPFAGFGSALDQRPPKMRMAPPPPDVSQLGSPPPATQLPASQLPVGSNGLTFEAKLVSSGGSSKVDRGSGGGAYVTAKSTETRASKLAVELRARNLGTAPGEAHFDWFFVAKDVQGKTPYVWDQGQRDVPLVGGGEQQATLESTELSRTTTKKTETRPEQNGFGQTTGYSVQSSTQSSGAKPYGWIVRLWSGDQLLQVRASSNDLEAMGRNFAKLPRLQ